MIIEKIRIGFIGAGQNTQKMHIPKLQALPGVELIEVANRTLGSAEKVANEFNIQRARSSWQGIVASDDVDAIVIGTGPTFTLKPPVRHLIVGNMSCVRRARMAKNLSEA
jgi:predicted dehydrogenase